MEKVYGVEVWHGTTQVYVYGFNTPESAERYKEKCLSNPNRQHGWNRYVSSVMEFETSEELHKYAMENEGSY
jgi:hypothetical protein